MDYTYDMFQNSIDMLADEIEIHMSQTEEEYDYVVGITRGGLVPAVNLSHKLGIRMIAVNWSTRDSDIRVLSEETLDLIRGKRILIVEDIVDSGKTLSQLTEALKDVCIVDIAALVYNTDQSIEPKFHAVTIDRKEYSDWINFFWEK